MCDGFVQEFEGSKHFQQKKSLSKGKERKKESDETHHRVFGREETAFPAHILTEEKAHGLLQGWLRTP